MATIKMRRSMTIIVKPSNIGVDEGIRALEVIRRAFKSQLY